MDNLQVQIKLVWQSLKCAKLPVNAFKELAVLNYQKTIFFMGKHA
jgi:hypothetical protein